MEQSCVRMRASNVTSNVLTTKMLTGVSDRVPKTQTETRLRGKPKMFGRLA